jgi:hypothetical protein
MFKTKKRLFLAPFPQLFRYLRGPTPNHKMNINKICAAIIQSHNNLTIFGSMSNWILNGHVVMQQGNKTLDKDQINKNWINA